MDKLILYRGHASDKHYLLTKSKIGPCFSENKDLARGYGKGCNDVTDVSAKDGFIATAEFTGILELVEKITGKQLSGIDLSNQVNENPSLVKFLIPNNHDAIRCKDNVIIVTNTTKLRLLETEKA